MTEAYRTVELVEDLEGQRLAVAALGRHLERMESRNQEPSGEYMTVLSSVAGGETLEVKWPIPMPKREEHIVLGYD